MSAFWVVCHHRRNSVANSERGGHENMRMKLWLKTLKGRDHSTLISSLRSMHRWENVNKIDLREIELDDMYSTRVVQVRG
jgi:hypothetical protein